MDTDSESPRKIVESVVEKWLPVKSISNGTLPGRLQQSKIH